ncbi:MAG TPA: hypothetical protein DGG95_05275 [Cytophagales bacterium]|jgi:hypothetical protein|nr:hypothetical protein [Cytophagales bacterium]
MDFEFNPISKQAANFVFVIAGFMTAFGIYFLSQADQLNYVFIIPSSLLFVPWLPFWFLVYRSSKIKFTKDKILKSSLLGKREMPRDKIQFFGVVYRERYSLRIIDPEQAVPFTLKGYCQIFISEKPANELRGTTVETIKIPFQREEYNKIKIWYDRTT